MFSINCFIPAYCSKYSSIYCFAFFLPIPNCSPKPKSLIPYTIPKFTAFALLLCSFVTSSIGVLNTFDAACLCISFPSLKASIICSSPEIDANTLNSICE